MTIFSNFLCLESVQLLHLHYAVFEFLVNLWDALETYPDALALFTHLAILYHPQVVVLATLEHSSNFIPRFLHIRLKLKVHHVLLTGTCCHLGASMLIRQQVLCQDILPDIDWFVRPQYFLDEVIFLKGAADANSPVRASSACKLFDGGIPIEEIRECLSVGNF